MFIKRKKLEASLRSVNENIAALKLGDETQRMLQGNILARQNLANTPAILKNIQKAEFKVYSQWKDDGIIQFLADYLDIDTKTFIEFGVEHYEEANTRFLLINNNWSGLIMDGSESNIKRVQQEDLYWRYNLKAVNAFVTAENINELITRNGFTGELGLLHIDIDGNDYWVWKAISVVSPVIVIMEYNAVFGSDKPWTVPYKTDFYRTDAHHSNLYFGSSLLSLCDLAEEKGYSFVGCNSNGNNAYFVRKDKLKDLQAVRPEQGFVNSQFRESRDQQGNLTYLSGPDRLKALTGMDVFNTRTQQIENI